MQTQRAQKVPISCELCGTLSLSGKETDITVDARRGAALRCLLLCYRTGAARRGAARRIATPILLLHYPSMALSRKVFVGGLPISVSTEMDLLTFFSRFGVVSVAWPDKRHFGPGSKIKGYAFLLFKVIESNRIL